jgi:hypothetical protein
MRQRYECHVYTGDRHSPSMSLRSSRGFKTLLSAVRACEDAAARNPNFKVTRHGRTPRVTYEVFDTKTGKVVHEANPGLVESVGERGYW